MEKRIMNKTTFGEICKILKDGKSDLHECISGVFEVALLFFPEIICKDVAFIMNIANGATILGAKPVIESAIKNIGKVFTQKKYVDFSTKYEHAQIAQVLIVFAAYFDSIKLYLPDEEKEINISPKEKQMLTDNSIIEYINYLEDNLSKSAEQNAKEVFEYDLTIPNPIVGLKDYLRELKKFYEILNKELLKFYEKLSFFDEMGEEKREQFLAVIRALPDKAVDNYEKQYYQLAVNFNDFFIWTNIEEHKAIRNKLDVGFDELGTQIADYFEKSANSKAKSTLEKYRKIYETYIETSVVDVSEMDFYSTNEVVFPNKSQIFVPQSFKAIVYKNNIHLEDRETWRNCVERDNIGKFVSDTLRHSITGSLPLLVLGHPGAGKSLLCNMLAARILQHEYHVIIVKLRDTVAEETVPQQINHQIERDFSNGCLWNDIVESGLDKPILVIFDGYDELLQASGRTYSDYLQRIVEFQKQQRDIYGVFVKCIVTSRITLIDKALISSNSPVIMLSDFDENRVNQWCKIWNEKNKDYFKRARLDEFEIDSSSKVAELARQPLLLLMLALYDSNDNALKRNKDLNETQLYDNLIREFISREKRKDDAFRRLQTKEQDRIINEEMIKISIAALGMYNRKILYIRSNELEKDLQFISQENNVYSETRNSELSESDKLLGSFFFIHKSNSTDMIDREKISNAAYEFLHNTFGEFLTANYIVNELNNVLSWVHTLVESKRQQQWKLCSQRAWVVCMAYAPLFSRPVVLRMIHEWAPGYFADENMDTVDEDLNSLLGMEIENIVNGNILFDLKEVMEEKNNPFFHDEFLKHLAIYSINLFMIRTIVFSNKYKFKLSNELWNKLLYIWKYAFSEDELLNFANQFTTNKESDGCELAYKGDPGNIFHDQITKYLRISSAIGDSVLYGIAGALIGESTTYKIERAIDNNQFNIRARHLWNYFLNDLVYSKYTQKYTQTKLIDIVCGINELSWKEGDIQYILCSYVWLDYLLKNRIVQLNKRNYYQIIEIIVRFCENAERLNFEYRGEALSIISDSISNLLDNVHLKDEDIERICSWIKRGYHSFYDSYSILNLIIKIWGRLTEYKERRELNTIPGIRYMEEYMAQIIYEIRRRGKLSPKLFTSFLELIDHYIISIDYIDSRKIEDIYFSTIEEMLYGHGGKREFTFAQKKLIIKSMYTILQRAIPFRENMLIIFNQAVESIDVKRLYENDEKIFYNLMVLMNHHIFVCHSRVINDVIWIVEHRGKELSLMNYRQIKKLAQYIISDRLLDSLERLLTDDADCDE